MTTAEIVLLLFATIGPLKVTVVAATLLANSSQAQVRDIAFRSVLIACVTCILFTAVGEAVLFVFGVSIPAFQIGGGIVVLAFSLEMAMGAKTEKQSEEPDPNSESSSDIAAYPLAVPLMVSVSGLVAIISFLAEHHGWTSICSLALIISAIMFLNYLSLVSCRVIAQAMGPTVILVVNRLMGVILVSLAIELILVGARGAGVIAATHGGP